MKISWKAQILQMAKSDIFCVKSADDEDSANGTWLRSVFVELEAFLCPKFALQTVFKNLILRYFLEGRCGLTPTAWSLKLT